MIVPVRLLFLFTSLALAVSACSGPRTSSRTYVAVVESVHEERALQPWLLVSPRKGRRPLYRIALRIREPAVAPADALLLVELYDDYDPDLHGRPGQEVSFTRAGPLPVDRIAAFDTLAAYSVLGPP